MYIIVYEVVMCLKKFRNMGRKQHSAFLQSYVKWDEKFREQGMLNDQPKRRFYKITLKNWKMFHYISPVTATLQSCFKALITSQKWAAASGIKVSSVISAFKAALSKKRWRKIKDWCFTLSYELLGKVSTWAILKDKLFHECSKQSTEMGSTTICYF